MKMRTVTNVVLAGLVLFAMPALAQDGGGASSNMEILLQKVKADKKLLVAANMNLNDADGKKFWPLYDVYQKDLEQLNQRLGAAIKAYADAHNAGKGMIQNDTAKTLLSEAFAVEEQELTLKRAYAKKLSTVLPATTVARAVQMGVPTPAFSSALAYYDGYRSARLPANLLQAQRDYFGAHTYERTDKPRGQFFHTNWTGEGGTTTAGTYTA